MKTFMANELPSDWVSFTLSGGPLAGQRFKLPPHAELYHHRDSKDGRVFEYELKLDERKGYFVKELERVNNQS